VEALATIIRAVAEGKISPSEGAALSSMMEAYRRASADAELAQRMDGLEATLRKAMSLLAGGVADLEPNIKRAIEVLSDGVR
jgi:hypothetical protein